MRSTIEQVSGADPVRARLAALPCTESTGPRRRWARSIQWIPCVSMGPAGWKALRERQEARYPGL